MATILLGAVLAVYEDSTAVTDHSSYDEEATERERVTAPLQIYNEAASNQAVSYPNHFLNWVARNRPARAIQNGGGARRSCNSVSYHIDSQIGQQASCPFEWIVNYESRRIPERIVEQVCRSCRSCGHNRFCVQLKVRYEVFFRDTIEYSHQEVRAGCVCMPHEVGSTANPYDILI